MMVDMGFKKVTAKTMKIGDYEKLGEALYIWFRQQRELNFPVSGAILQEKARILFERLYPDSTKEFIASTGCYPQKPWPVSLKNEQKAEKRSRIV